MSLSDAVYVQMGNSSAHIGCAEPSLQRFEHLLLPRALWCDEVHCWSRGSLDLKVQRIECDSDDICDVSLHCSECVKPVLYGLAVTAVGTCILFFFCFAREAPEVPKDHQL